MARSLHIDMTILFLSSTFFLNMWRMSHELRFIWINSNRIFYWNKQTSLFLYQMSFIIFWNLLKCMFSFQQIRGVPPNFVTFSITHQPILPVTIEWEAPRDNTAPTTTEGLNPTVKRTSLEICCPEARHLCLTNCPLPASSLSLLADNNRSAEHRTKDANSRIMKSPSI